MEKTLLHYKHAFVVFFNVEEHFVYTYEVKS